MPRPSVPRFLAAHFVLGAGIGWALLGLLVCADVTALGRLIAADPAAGRIAIAMMLVAFGLTFGTTAMGTAMVLLDGRPDPAPTGRRRPLRPVLALPAMASPRSPGRRSGRRSGRRDEMRH